MNPNFDYLLDNPTELTTGALLGTTLTHEDQAAAEQKAIQFFQHVRLLSTENSVVLCPFRYDDSSPCGRRMKVEKDSSRSRGFRFYCNGTQRSPHLKTRINPRTNTLFDNASLPFYKILQIIVAFCTRKTVTEAMDSIHLSSSTAVAWYRYLRAAAYATAWHDYKPLGGQTFVIEVDESHLFTAKYNRGRRSAFQKQDMWIFGGVCRSTGKTLDVLVHHRDRETLFTHMRDLIEPGSNVFSDGWKAYSGCQLPSPVGCDMASHHVVIHKNNFVSPPAREEPAWVSMQDWDYDTRDKKFIGPYPEGLMPIRFHTQTRERKWRSEKDLVKTGNKMNWERIEDYLGYFMYLENILKQHKSASGRFRRFLSDLGRVYPGPLAEGIKDKFRGVCKCADCTD